MSKINQLGPEDTLSAGKLMAMFDLSHGNARKITLTQLLDYVQENAATSIGRHYVDKQYEARSATGWSVIVQDNGNDVWLNIDPVDDYAAGTIVFPADPVDQQQVWYRVSKLVTTLTVDLNGHSGWSGPGAITVTTFLYRAKYLESTDSWYWA